MINALYMWSGDGRDRIPNFAALAQKGVVGVVHRATEGIQFTDPFYIDRREAAIAAGLKWGAMHTIDANETTLQADRFLGSAGNGDFLYAVNFDNSNQPAALHQLYDFCGYIDRNVNGVSIVVRGGNYLRTVFSEPQPGSPTPSPVVGGIVAYMVQHRFWFSDAVYSTDNIPAVQYPWQQYFFRDVILFPPDAVIGKSGTMIFDGAADTLRNSWRS